MIANTNNKRTNATKTLYMSFVVDPKFKKDVMKSLWNYAARIADNGIKYFENNLIRINQTSDCTIHWDYELAQEGDWYCKFCCASQKSNVVVNGFVNSRLSDDINEPGEVCYLRLAMCGSDAKANSAFFRGHSGTLNDYESTQSFDDCWIRVSGDTDSLYLKQSA